MTPGKVILFGEYAVLHGEAALVCAVDRGVSCGVEPADVLIVDGGHHGHIERRADGWQGDPLPFARAMIDALPHAPIAAYHLDSSALSVNGIKLGLGSSAASTVALARAAWPHASAGQIYAKAQAVHRAVQGTGSGADIAASAFGGTIAYWWFETHAPGSMRAGDGFGQIEVLPPNRETLAMVWAGQPASTPELVGRVRSWAQQNPASHADLMARIGAAALDGIRAWCDQSDLRPAARATREALTELGSRSGAPILTQRHFELAEAVADLDVVVKPTGAGGGDLAWLVGASAEAEHRALERLEAAGHLTLALSIT